MAVVAQTLVKWKTVEWILTAMVAYQLSFLVERSLSDFSWFVVRRQVVDMSQDDFAGTQG